LKIIEQAINNLPEGPYFVDDPQVFIPPKDKVYTKMEELIDHFKIMCDGVKDPSRGSLLEYRKSQGGIGFSISKATEDISLQG